MRRLSRAAFAATVIAVVCAALTACGGSPDGRLEGATTTTTRSGDVVVDGGLPVNVPTTAEPGAAPPTTARRSPNQERACEGDANSFIPASLPGYTITGSADVAALAGSGELAKYVKGAGAAVAAGADGKNAVITAVVIQPDASSLAGATTDAVVLALIGGDAAAKSQINGYVVYTGTQGPRTGYVMQYCENVYISVYSENSPDVALDVTTKLLG